MRGLAFSEHNRQVDIVPRTVSLRNVICLILMGICIQMSVSVILAYILSFQPPSAGEYAEVMDNLIRYDLKTVLMVVFGAPLLEEFIFRYTIMVFGEFFAPFWAANTIQAILFGIYHGNVIQGAYTFLLGLLLGVVAHKLGGIIASIILHMSINSAGLLQGLIFPGEVALIIRIVFVVVGLTGIILIFRYGLRYSDKTAADENVAE